MCAACARVETWHRRFRVIVSDDDRDRLEAIVKERNH